MNTTTMTVFEVAQALGHDVCETCKDQVCTNPGHRGCAFDLPGYRADGLVWCHRCGPDARLENEPTDVQSIPLACDVEETTPVRHETARELAQKMDRRAEGLPEPRARERGQWIWAFLVVAASAVGFFACASAPHAPATEVESVGTLSAGPSVYSAPLKHDAPPEVVGVVDTGDDIPETGPSAADILRAENAKGGTVQGEEKVAHGF